MIEQRLANYLSRLNETGNLRRIPKSKEGLVDLLSNDYLTLGARETEFHEEFFDLYPDIHFSSCASRLLSRRNGYHDLLEETLTSLYNKDVLLFNSGYHANTGILSALASPSTLFLADTLIHASAHDGLSMARQYRGATVEFFPHNDTAAMERLIEENKNSGNFSEIVIVTEGIFSMDGDCSPLLSLVELKRRHPEIVLYLDEAHSFGVRGKQGLGLAEELNVIPEVDIIMGTLGKAAASTGAFCASSPTVHNFLVNRARSFIFSTAIPPINAAWSHFMISKLTKMNAERERLNTLGRYFADLVSGIGNSPFKSESQIVPVVCGSSEKAIELASLLRQNGYDALPIRKPTVPPGSERIRFSLNSSLSEEVLDDVGRIVAEGLPPSA